MRVLEVGGGIAAAFATHLLGGYGADVVRVEGDDGVPLTDDEAVYLLAGKRRVALDDSEDGRAEMRALALAVDLVVEDQPPGALAARGLDPAALRAERPDLIVVS